MKEFTQEMLNALTEANNNVKGTNKYYKFQMSYSRKYDDSPKWKFLSHGIPSATGKIKTFKGQTYIYTEHRSFWGDYLERYEVTDAVKELLGI
jgi:hypothetical protein